MTAIAAPHRLARVVRDRLTDDSIAYNVALHSEGHEPALATIGARNAAAAFAIANCINELAVWIELTR